ncbi:MAG: AurF N-oxygenase family protein [Sciscionella sp.]
MSRAIDVAKVSDREKTAERLLCSSADKFYDPEVDIDWNAPLVDGKYFTPPHRTSLYGTKLWDSLSDAQRIELGKHELASVASNGIWFEVLLMQMLLKEVYRSDPTERHAQYALTEIADECRHSTMFARAIERVGVPAYGPRRLDRQIAKILPVIGYGPALYGSILVVEEILDRIQRESMADDGVQPLVRMVNRIHVLEEARHVTFAREEVVRGMPNLSTVELTYQRWLIGFVSFFITRNLVNPRVYKSVGIRPRDGWEAANGNPHFQETLRWSGERIMKFLDEVGLIGAPGMHWWRRSHLLG